MKNRLKVLRAERIETGKYDPSLPLAIRIGRLFGRPVEEIFLDNGQDAGGDR